jgi:hypothetical protein
VKRIFIKGKPIKDINAYANISTMHFPQTIKTNDFDYQKVKVFPKKSIKNNHF